MKKIYLLFTVLTFISCSVDNEDVLSAPNSFEGFNAVVETDGCESEYFSFGNAGFIDVRNDTEFLYVTIVANDTYELTRTKLHIADSENNFPTVGQGNLPPGQMDHKEKFDSAVKSHDFKLSLSNYEGCIYIASQSEFSNGADSETYWAGEINGNSGNWSYFEYCIQTCGPSACQIDAGPDDVWEISLSEAKAIGSEDELKHIYFNLLKTRNDGTFEPSFTEIVDAFWAEDGGVGEYPVTYTVTNPENGCTDSVVWTLRVLPDSAEE